MSLGRQESIGNARATIENLGSSREALRAIEYAPDDVKVFYSGEIERIKRKWEADLAQWVAKRKELEEKLHREYVENQQEEKRRKRAALWISVVITGCLVIAAWEPEFPLGRTIVEVFFLWGIIYALLRGIVVIFIN